MSEPQKQRFFCSLCGSEISENDILSGAAIRRFHEIYCLEHFNEKFPDECLSHPGTAVTTQCSHCGRWACDDCFVELAGKKVCHQCKPAILGELITGQPALVVEKRKRGFRPFRIGRDVIRRLAGRRKERVIKRYLEAEPSGPQPKPLDPDKAAFASGLLGLALPIFIPAAIICNVEYRSKVKHGKADRTVLGDLGLLILIASVVVWTVVIAGLILP